ncbi:Crp/Fnr family transcriptional regulator [Microvirga makkahensis]|uniref:Helix-turn-helix domain-containing protein n=1 Tax=Microvirga makkahensis TaxID=1128670 RepID=A0A7X3SPN5_9HYPH|nr:Crp/Fnr family transcriptional regulator [Microvirga makkahensis]MXQ12408.1 helix-turn-helix domain-containing protein [Microvirga makkahensis]
MSQPQQSAVRNRLLKALSPDDFALLQPHLEPMDLTLRQMVIEAGEPIQHAHFVEEGILSLLAKMPHDRIEIGMAGREGMTNVAAAFGAERSPHAMMCQADGQGLRISADALRSAVQQSPSLSGLLGRYLYYLTIQTGQTAFANASLNVEARLARWVLMTHDRTDGFELSLTHDFLATMLGVRRPGVTTATHVLEGAGMIRTERGRIIVLNREKLEELADDAYGMAEAEYERLIQQA